MTDDPTRALEAVLKLTALEERSAELKASLERIERKLELLVDRLSKVEAQYDRLDRLNGDPTTAAGDAASEVSVASDVDPLARPFLTVVSEE